MPGPLDRNFAAWRALRLTFILLTVGGVLVALVLTIGHGGGKGGAGTTGGVGPVVNSTCPLVICPPP